MIWGLDGNAQVGSAIHESEEGVMGRFGGLVRDSRGQYLIEKCQAGGLTIENTFEDVPVENRATRRQAGIATTIDYVFTNKHSFVTNCSTKVLPVASSDHIPIVTCVKVPAMEKHTKKQSRKPVGWTPQCEEAYVHELGQETNRCDTEASFTEAVGKVAERNAAKHQSSRQKHREEQRTINRLKKQWRGESSQEAKWLIGKRISQELGRLRKLRMERKKLEILKQPARGGWGRSKTKSHTLFKFETTDENEVGQNIQNHFTVQFTDESKWLPPEWVFSRFQETPKINRWQLEHAIQELKLNKSCPRDSGVVGEMLKPLVKDRETNSSETLEILTRIINEDLAGSDDIFQDDHVDVEIILCPKTRVVKNPGQLRPIALVPVTRKLIGGMALNLTQHQLDNHDPWQFAYKTGVQVADVHLLLILMGQKAIEWSKPYILGMADIPKCFDELRHDLLMETLIHKQIPQGLVAWFMREIRNTRYFLKIGNDHGKPIECTRGIPQGTKWGPKMCTAALSYLLTPVWESCQIDRLGYHFDIQNVYVPFVFFCDNVFIMAHSTKEFQEILMRIRQQLLRGGWRLPDDRVEWQPNKFVPQQHYDSLPRYKRLENNVSFKGLGCMINARGNTHADFVFKTHIVKSAIAQQKTLWNCKAASRASKMKLMMKVAEGAICWSVGHWKPRQRDLVGLRGMMLNQFKKIMRLPRKPAEEDSQYHRRLVSAIKRTKEHHCIPNLDDRVMSRMYDYIGHLVRTGTRDPNNLAYIALCHRNREWCLQHQQIFGHQGHQGRVQPWTFERQFYEHFEREGRDWMSVAENKTEWTNHLTKRLWVESRTGSPEFHLAPIPARIYADLESGSLVDEFLHES